MQLQRPQKISTNPAVDAAAVQAVHGAFTQIEQALKAGALTNGQLVSSTGVLADMPPGREIAHNEVTGAVTISATTEGTANTIVSSSAFTFDGVTKCVLEWYFPDVSMGAGATLTLILHDGTNPLGVIHASTVTGTLPGWSGCRPFVPAAGLLSYSIRGFRAVANCTINVGAGGAGTRMPGFIRITKA